MQNKKVRKTLVKSVTAESMQNCEWKQKMHTGSDGITRTWDICSAKLGAFKGNIVLSDHEIVVGGKVIVYSSQFSLEHTLPTWVHYLNDDQAADHIVNADNATVRDVMAEDSRRRSISQCIRDAVRYVTEAETFWGSTVKFVSDNSPLFIMEVYGMQDSLYFAMEDAPDAEPDELFEYMVFGYGWRWWMALTGSDTALSIFREFFDAYYPKVRNRGTC